MIKSIKDYDKLLSPQGIENNKIICELLETPPGQPGKEESIINKTRQNNKTSIDKQ